MPPGGSRCCLVCESALRPSPPPQLEQPTTRWSQRPYVLALFLGVHYRSRMFGISPFEPVTWEDVEGALADAIRSSAGGQMTRNAEVFLAGVCAKHLSERLALAGFVVMRRAAPLAEAERLHRFDTADL